jgi:hypothetical protein
MSLGAPHALLRLGVLRQLAARGGVRFLLQVIGDADSPRNLAAAIHVPVAPDARVGLDLPAREPLGATVRRRRCTLNRSS